MKRLLIGVLLAGLWIVGGCGKSAPPTGDPAKKISWEQYQKMPPEDQADPYVLNNLDEAARKKFDEMAKQKGKR